MPRLSTEPESRLALTFFGVVMNHDQILEEYQKDQKKREEDAREAEIEKKYRIENKFCYCDLQKHFPYDSQVCEFCYEKIRQDVNQDEAAEMADAHNKHYREQLIGREDNIFMPLRSKN